MSFTTRSNQTSNISALFTSLTQNNFQQTWSQNPRKHDSPDEGPCSANVSFLCVTISGYSSFIFKLNYVNTSTQQRTVCLPPALHQPNFFPPFLSQFGICTVVSRNVGCYGGCSKQRILKFIYLLSNTF